MDLLDVHVDDPELLETFDDVVKYDFDFENLAFEGGGAKMAAYFGSVKVSSILVLAVNTMYQFLKIDTYAAPKQ